ncbi:MAG: PAS domain-containing protein, partial [Bacteroidales bacterium]|nr:PAS domain-containing protein [Bacteroidales bacterium]
SDHLNNPQQVGYIKNINDNPNWYDTPFKRLPEMYIYSIFHDENNVTWIGGSELIYRYDPDKDNLEYDSQYNTLIRKVTINQDSIIFSGTQHYDKTTKSYKQSGIPEIEFKNNTILFYFSAVEYSDKKNHKFQHYLVGYDKKWSSFSDISFKEYTNLPKGNYTFRVKAINTYGCESTEAFYQFVILTPWYSSILAYVIYVILFIVLFILTVKLNIKRLKAHNKHLEKLVKERTSEITQQKEEISTQAENLLKANEELEKLSIAVSKTDNAIVIMDAKGNFEWVNDGFTRLYNLTFDEFITKRGKNILDCSSNPNIKEELHKCIYEKETISYEFFYLTESNKKVWTQTTITPILDDKNEVIRLIAIDSDITDVKLAENEILQKNEEILAQKDELEKHRFHLEKLVKERTTDLEKAKEKAEESDRLKSSFLANMSHEIRTPMNAIVGFTNLLNDPEISPAQREELSKLVIHNSDTLLRLIDDIIDIAKLESGQLVIEKQNFDLNNLLVKKFKIFNENNQLINKGHLALKFNNKTNNEQFIIYSDPLRIQQILSNLINNALKYTDQGFVEFGYKPEVHHKKPVITFYVKDTGIGLSGEQQKIIFSRFTKVEDNKKKLYRGAGLGLAISKNIVELLGGNIWVESETGKGSVFYFTITL